jgi:hypothetical protein
MVDARTARVRELKNVSTNIVLILACAFVAIGRVADLFRAR